ncbi:MAG: ThiF family adenylyltransferase [Woeseiaceae bacterium]
MCAAPTNDRDARHLSLPGFGSDGVARLRSARALVIGVGGTGCAAASALTAAGVGHLTLNDFDRVDASNLARQTLYAECDVGQPKASTAKRRLNQQNPDCSIDVLEQRLDADACLKQVATHDIVLDCTDNFSTRFLINRAVVAAGKPLISGAAIRWEGQVAVFGPDYRQSSCFACLFSPDDESLEDCQGAGVIGPLPMTIGATMATEAIKVLTGIGEAPSMTLYDARFSEWRAVSVPKNTTCDVCNTR